MATEGISNVYAKISALLGHVPLPELKANVTSVFTEELQYGCSHVGQLLRRYVPEGEAFQGGVQEVDLLDRLLGTLHHGWVSEAGPAMKHGVWDHFKGGVYLSTGVGKHAETDAWEVEYISLLHGTKHHRRCEQWNEVVEWPDGKYRSRFIFRGVDLESCDPPTFKVPLSDKTRQHVARTLFSILK